MSFARKLKRQQLKNEIGSNKIKEEFHKKDLTVEDLFKGGKKDGIFQTNRGRKSFKM